MSTGRVAALAGERRGYLTVISLESVCIRYGRRNANWLCRCDCGAIVTRTTLALNRKQQRPSCGCQTLALRADSVRAAAAARLAAAPQWHTQGNEAHINLAGGWPGVIDAADLEVAKSRGWLMIVNRSGLRYIQSTTSPRVFLHNLIMGRKMIDHADGNGLNNRRSNLRLCTAQQNQANRRKQSGTKSVYKGVRLRLGRSGQFEGWGCEIECNGKRYYLGRFGTEADAARAYDRKAAELFGEFARLNFPEAAPA